METRLWITASLFCESCCLFCLPHTLCPVPDPGLWELSKSWFLRSTEYSVLLVRNMNDLSPKTINGLLCQSDRA